MVPLIDKRRREAEWKLCKIEDGDRFEVSKRASRKSPRKGYFLRVLGHHHLRHHQRSQNFIVMSAVSQTAKNYRVLLKHIKALPSAENWKRRVVEQVTHISYVIRHLNSANLFQSFCA